jgi:hypothetical protein
MGTQCSAATGRIVHVVSQRKRSGAAGVEVTTTTASPSPASTAEVRVRPLLLSGSATALRNGTVASGDIGGRSGGKGDPTGGVRRTEVLPTPHAERLADAARGKCRDVTAGGRSEVLLRLAVWYWDLIAPVFDAGSPVSARLSAGKSTWQDCGVYALALVFVLGAFLAAVWSVKAVLLVVGLGRTVVRGVAVVFGF